MDKRYQVFVSSTFRDLQDERQAALRAVLELDHMPAGMELFPAQDDTAWQLIQEVIDSSDYYVLIVGGRYGSLDEEGLGYTEKEYDYAVASGKPVIALLHEDPDNLPREKTETEEAAWARLQEFRAKVEQSHTCVYWTSAEHLKSRLIVSLTATVKRHPAVGWVRASEVPSGADIGEALALRQRIDELESALDVQRTAPPPGTETLMQGDDSYELDYGFVARERVGYQSFDTSYTGSIKPTWNEIFAAVAPAMISEASSAELRSAFRRFFTAVAREALADNKDLEGRILREFSYADSDFDTCIVQLRALGLITESERKRSVKDTQTYWSLTPFGDTQMVRLRALHRPTIGQRPKGKPIEQQDPDGQT